MLDGVERFLARDPTWVMTRRGEVYAIGEPAFDRHQDLRDLAHRVALPLAARRLRAVVTSDYMPDGARWLLRDDGTLFTLDGAPLTAGTRLRMAQLLAFVHCRGTSCERGPREGGALGAGVTDGGSLVTLWRTPHGVDARGEETPTRVRGLALDPWNRWRCAVGVDDRVYCQRGKLGGRGAFVPVAAVRGAAEVVLERDLACARTTDRRLWCWRNEAEVRAVEVTWARGVESVSLRTALRVRMRDGRVVTAFPSDGEMPPRARRTEALDARAMQDDLRRCVIGWDDVLRCEPTFRGTSDLLETCSGDGGLIASRRFHSIPGLEGVVRLIDGRDGLCALQRDGRLMCWSRTWHERSRDVTPRAVASNVVEAEENGDAMMILRGTGALTWVTATGEHPVDAPHDVTHIVAANDRSVCALTRAQRVVCWSPLLRQVIVRAVPVPDFDARGARSYNVSNTVDDPWTGGRRIPVRGLSRVVELAGGTASSATTLRDDGAVFAIDLRDDAASVERLAGLPRDARSLITGRVAGSLASRAACVRAPGGVWCQEPPWRGSFVTRLPTARAAMALLEDTLDGMDSDVATSLRAAPDVLERIEDGRTSCVLRADGLVRCLGDNLFGQLGEAPPSHVGLRAVRVAD